MKILMLLEVDYPPDSRVEKEMISLSEDGHEVMLACVTHNRNMPQKEETEHYTIYRKYIGKKAFDRWRVTPLVFPYYFSWWRSFAKEIYLKTKFDAVHVHDLPLSKVGFYFKKKYGLKLICDQHEFYSDWIKDTAHMNTLAGKTVLAFSNWVRYEKKYLSLADLVVTVTDPLRENYIKKHKLPSHKIITIPNTPTQRIFNRQNISPEIISQYKNEFVIFYAGVLDILRGINTAIEAIPAILKEIPNVRLLLGGRLAKQYDPVQVAQRSGISEHVSFIGWINESDLPSYIEASKICFFTPPASRDEINKTIATKIYQYAIMGKPIITSDAKMMKEFVETNQLGISIESGNSQAFAHAVIQIYNNQFITSQSKKPDEWYWEETVKPLKKIYYSL